MGLVSQGVTIVSADSGSSQISMSPKDIISLLSCITIGLSINESLINDSSRAASLRDHRYHFVIISQ